MEKIFLENSYYINLEEATLNKKFIFFFRIYYMRSCKEKHVSKERKFWKMLNKFCKYFEKIFNTFPYNFAEVTHREFFILDHLKHLRFCSPVL